LSRRGSNVEVRHIAEVLADMTAEVPPIGVPANPSPASRERVASPKGEPGEGVGVRRQFAPSPQPSPPVGERGP
jgi:hypothetical protein